jgi:hypothetical protein
LRVKHLKSLIADLDDEAVVEARVDLDNDGGRWQTRRIVEVRQWLGNVIMLELDGGLTPDEERKIDDGLYECLYDEWRSHWDGVPPSIRDEMILKVEYSLKRASVWREYEWSALKRVTQERIMVRVPLPEPVLLQQTSPLSLPAPSMQM